MKTYFAEIKDLQNRLNQLTPEELHAVVEEFLDEQAFEYLTQDMESMESLDEARDSKNRNSYFVDLVGSAAYIPNLVHCILEEHKKLKEFTVVYMDEGKPGEHNHCSIWAYDAREAETKFCGTHNEEIVAVLRDLMVKEEAQ